MRIAHLSDLHGCLSAFGRVSAPDLWVVTGDLFPNRTRGIRTVEVPFQEAWFASVKDEMFTYLRGRPLVWVGGNHDYVSLAHLLRDHGYPGQVWDIEDGPVDFGGERLAGFRHIPWIAGEWNGETHDLRPVVEAALAHDPTILVTHAPPAGILDDDNGGGHGYGVEPLSVALAYHPHRIRLLLYGHIHAQGGNG